MKRARELIVSEDVDENIGVDPAPTRGSFDDVAGHIDRCDGHTLEGWAQVPLLPHLTAVVEIIVDGEQIGRARANVFREDLRDAGIRDGLAAFRFKLPATLCDGARHVLEVRERVSGTMLGGIREFRAEPRPELPRRSQLFTDGVVLAKSADTGAFARAAAQHRRAAFLCVFSPDNLLYASHHRLIEALQRAGFAVLLGQALADGDFIECGAPTPPASRADAFIVKENRGYDFGTWLASYASVRDQVNDIDELLFINDSVFGPLFDIGRLFEQLSSRPEDVVGLCDSYEYNYHLQSFFLLFRRTALKSGVLDRFADAYSYSDDKAQVVREGEIALTSTLLRAGLSCAALYPYEKLTSSWLSKLPSYLAEVEALPENARLHPDGRRSDEFEYLLNLARHIRRGDPVNPSHAFWDILLDMKCPFIKRDLLFKNPTGHPLLYRAAAAIEATGYPLDLIRQSAKHFGASKVFV